MYRGALKSLAQPTSQCILFDGENISFDASLVMYVCIYVCMYVCVCVCVCIYIYIYIVLIFLQL
jgi:hypothetical protein